ncbi:MAG: M48 family metallopeptidase [Deltaproteobacteria bacterium]|nr:M48 family metallopeptidase [Deltaproteobacteria bacterium]
MKYTPRQPQSNVNVTPTSPLKDFFVLAGGLLAIVVIIYLLLGLAVDVIAPHISMDLENKMAPLVGASFKMDRKDPSKRTQFLQSIVDNIQKNCTRLPYRFQVHIHPSKDVNAIALPGGHILVFLGLLERMSSENELAFILAHEMGHYAHRDHLRGLGRALVFMTVSTFFFGADSSVSKMLSKTLHLTELSLSRKQETWADAFALKTLQCAYGHVAGATDFFEKIPKEQDPGKFGHYFASHPENRRRISQLKGLIRIGKFDRLKRKVLPEGFQDLTLNEIHRKGMS